MEPSQREDLEGKLSAAKAVVDGLQTANANLHAQNDALTATLNIAEAVRNTAHALHEITRPMMQRQGRGFETVSVIEQRARKAVEYARQQSGSETYLALELNKIDSKLPGGLTVYGIAPNDDLTHDAFTDLFIQKPHIASVLQTTQFGIFGKLISFAQNIESRAQTYFQSVATDIALALQNAREIDIGREQLVLESDHHVNTKRILDAEKQYPTDGKLHMAYHLDEQGKTLKKEDAAARIASGEELKHIDIAPYFLAKAGKDLLTQRIRAAEKTKRNLVVIFGDVDYFRNYNGKPDMNIEGYGHMQGDVALTAIAEAAFNSIRHAPLAKYLSKQELIKHLLNESDHVDFAIRAGGEELAWVMDGMSLEAAIGRASAICEAVQKIKVPRSEGLDDKSVNFSYVTHNGVPRAYTDVFISIGVASLDQFLPGDCSAERLLGAADSGSLQAKAAGKACVRVYKK